MEEFRKEIEPYLAHADVLRLGDFLHHRHKDRLTHSLEVAWHSFRIARYLKLDTRAIVRGAILHDLFWYDWLREGPRLHGFRHPAIAHKNAKELFELSPKESDIIIKHMWPLTWRPPRYAESWIVCLSDTLLSILDYLPFRLKSTQRLQTLAPAQAFAQLKNSSRAHAHTCGAGTRKRVGACACVKARIRFYGFTLAGLASIIIYWAL